MTHLRTVNSCLTKEAQVCITKAIRRIVTHHSAQDLLSSLLLCKKHTAESIQSVRLLCMGGKLSLSYYGENLSGGCSKIRTLLGAILASKTEKVHGGWQTFITKGSMRDSTSSLSVHLHHAPLTPLATVTFPENQSPPTLFPIQLHT